MLARVASASVLRASLRLSAAPAAGVARALATSPQFSAGAVGGADAPQPKQGKGPLFWAGLIGVPTLIGGAMFYTNSRNSELREKQVAWKSNPVPALDPTAFRPFTLKEANLAVGQRQVIPVNHNMKIFRFALPEGTTHLGLPTASCVVTKFQDGVKPDGKPNIVIRPYTPIEDPGLGYTGTFDLLIKKYPTGVMSSHIFSLKPGDTLDIKGPIPKFEYKASEVPHIGMIAGGSGITPMLQVIQRVLSNPADKTLLSLVFANVSEADIPLRDYFDKLAKEHGDQIRVYHTISKEAPGWTQGVGHVTADMLKKFMPAPGEGKVFFCGPPGMMEFVSGPKGPKMTQGEVGGLLKQMGYTENDVYKF
ncbi:hypothetical protein BC831DRAFT_395454 [Entophlyctis helioformis]|nr:hypothetical protein BC831DRAFT_395454 [Entophlyctis helioformis]